MKKIGLVFIGITAISALSFTLIKNNQVLKINSIEKPIQYKLDTKASVLNWKGEKSADHFHTGSVSFSQGIVKMDGGILSSGSFIVNMNSIRISDDMEEGKISYLTKHLMSADFFNTEKFPKVTVSVEGLENGKLSTTMDVMGITLKNTIPVSISETEDKLIINGNFDIDFASLKLPGMQIDPESGEAISSIVHYGLNLVLTK